MKQQEKMRGTARYKGSVPIYIVSMNLYMGTAIVSDDDTLRGGYSVLIEDLDRWEWHYIDKPVQAFGRPNAGYGITDTAKT